MFCFHLDNIFPICSPVIKRKPKVADSNTHSYGPSPPQSSPCVHLLISHAYISFSRSCTLKCCGVSVWGRLSWTCGQSTKSQVTKPCNWTEGTDCSSHKTLKLIGVSTLAWFTKTNVEQYKEDNYAKINWKSWPGLRSLTYKKPPKEITLKCPLSCCFTVGHQFVNKWATLSIPGDVSTGVKGYLKCDISISAKGETIQPGPKASDAEEQIDKYVIICFLHNHKL